MAKQEKRNIYLGNPLYLAGQYGSEDNGLHGTVAKDEIEAREKIKDYCVRMYPGASVNAWVVDEFRKLKIVKGVSLEQTVKTLENAEIHFIK